MKSVTAMSVLSVDNSPEVLVDRPGVMTCPR